MTPPTIVLMTTGGTIACTADENGDLKPTLSGTQLAAGFKGVKVRELSLVDSSAMSLRDIDGIRNAIKEEFEDPAVSGVVITHGTDSMEDTAMALAAFHDDQRAVVLTGAQRHWDHPESDGPANLAHAVEVAKTHHGVCIAFGGMVINAVGAHKVHTEALQGFSAEDAGTLLPLPDAALADAPNVEIIYAWPGAPKELIIDAINRGVGGLVIAALGSGNMGPQLAAGVRYALSVGVPVVISTRVCRGSVRATYGGAGGGAQLQREGTISSGALKPAQARMLLIAALAAGAQPREVFSVLR